MESPLLSPEEPTPPTPPFVDGRGPRGQFTKGNAGGPGNPFAARVAKLRKAMFAAVTPADLKAVIETLIREARGGNIPAIRELLERTLGKPVEYDLLERIEALEARLAELGEKGVRP